MVLLEQEILPLVVKVASEYPKRGHAVRGCMTKDKAIKSWPTRAQGDAPHTYYIIHNTEASLKGLFMPSAGAYKHLYVDSSRKRDV